jgi:hypothetical protein
MGRYFVLEAEIDIKTFAQAEDVYYEVLWQLGPDGGVHLTWFFRAPWV